MKKSALIAAIATLATAVLPSVALAQVTFTGTYAQTQITQGAAGQLALSLANPTGVALTAGAYAYTFPAGTWTFLSSSGCIGGSLTSSGGTSTATVTNLGVAAAGTCTLNFSLQPANTGVYGLTPTAVTYAGADSASPQNLTGGANPTLTVVAPVAIPTMSEWAMILLGLMLAGGAALYIQRRQSIT